MLPHQLLARIFFLDLPTIRRVSFVLQVKQLYGLLQHHYWQGFFALVISSVTSNETNILPLKMGLLSLGIAFARQGTLW